MEQTPSEKEPNYDNVHFLDECPDLKKRVWLRRLNNQRIVGKVATTEIFYLPEITDPDDAS